MSSALTAPPTGAFPTPTATMVLPSSARRRAVSPTLPAKPLDSKNRWSSSTIAPSGTTPSENRGTPRYSASAGTSGPAVNAIGIGLLLCVLCVLCARGQRLAFLPAGHRPEQIGQSVEVGHDEAAFRGRDQRQPFGAAHDGAGHVEQRRGP